MILNVDNEITIELIKEDHAGALFELVQANKLRLAEWLPWVDKLPTVRHFESFCIDSARRYAEGSEMPMTILYDGKVAGRIGVYNIDMQNKIASIGYWLGDKFQGKGIVTKACRQTVDYAFYELGLNRIEIKCGAENLRSQAIPHRLQFVKEGILRQAEFINNRFIDLILYSKLKSEWPAPDAV